MTFWENTAAKLESGQSAVVMIVVKSEGSSPGKPGFKMAVSADGEIWGSIGGGNMEFRLAQQCRSMLREKSRDIIIKKQDHHPDSKEANSGMICSGVQWIAFYPLECRHTNLVKQIVSIGNNRQKETVVYTEKGISIINTNSEANNLTPFVNNNTWLYTEQPGLKNRLYIFGAGHVSLALSKLAADVGFDVVVYDSRKGINTFESNSYIYKKGVIDYKEAANFVKEGNHIYVVIMTFAHQSDKVVLKQLIHKKINYLGMMGSDLKVASIFGDLQKEGITKADLEKVDAPVGLPVNSITPAEIAVSIMAKIIQVKNSGL